MQVPFVGSAGLRLWGMDKSAMKTWRLSGIAAG